MRAAVAWSCCYAFPLVPDSILKLRVKTKSSSLEFSFVGLIRARGVTRPWVRGAHKVSPLEVTGGGFSLDPGAAFLADYVDCIQQVSGERGDIDHLIYLK